MATELSKSPIVDIVMKLVVIGLGGAVVAFANIPSRVSVLESKQADVTDTIKGIDHKLDILIQRAR